MLGFLSSLIIAVIVGLSSFFGKKYYYRKKLFDKCNELATAYQAIPKKAEETYASSIVMFRYPMANKENETFNTPIFHEIDVLKDYLKISQSKISDDSYRSLLALLKQAEQINTLQKKLDFSTENIEKTKNDLRQYVSNWCYVAFTLKKLGTNRNKYTPLNSDTADFNINIQDQLGICIDENILFYRRMDELGYTFQSAPKD